MISQYMMDTDAPKYSKAFQFFILWQKEKNQLLNVAR